MKTGPLNLITDVAGLHVGNAEDSRFYVPALLQSCSS